MERPTNFYGQHGEDFVLWEVFKGKTDGFFIEVGALDGVRFSNTYVFEKAGWNGMCVEPHPDYAPHVRRQRKCMVVEAAVDEVEGRLWFHANKCGSLSTLDPSMEEEFKGYGPYFTGFEPFTIDTFRLDTLVKKHMIPTIDILSIDVEGTDYRALKSLNLKLRRPRAIVIEVARDERAIHDYLTGRGYHLGIPLANNRLYFDRADDALESFRAFPRMREVNLVHPPNPVFELDR